MEEQEGPTRVGWLLHLLRHRPSSASNSSLRMGGFLPLLLPLFLLLPLHLLLPLLFSRQPDVWQTSQFLLFMVAFFEAETLPKAFLFLNEEPLFKLC